MIKAGQPCFRLDSSLHEGRNVVMMGRLVKAADINRPANNGDAVVSALHTIEGKRYVKQDKTMPISVLPIIRARKLLRCC